jgi:hypothetical protein
VDGTFAGIGESETAANITIEQVTCMQASENRLDGMHGRGISPLFLRGDGPLAIRKAPAGMFLPLALQVSKPDRETFQTLTS